MKELLFLVPVVGLAGLLFAIFLKSYVIKQDPGNDRMREIADAIAEGARAFLASEYRILVIFVAVLFVVIGVGTRNWVTAVCFLTGSIFSTAAGYLGMSAAIRANFVLFRFCFLFSLIQFCIRLLAYFRIQLTLLHFRFLSC